VGFTHASSVIAFVRRSEGASGIVTFALVPLKARAPPYFPCVDQVAVPIVPVLPEPEASAAVVPEPSLKE
jgi:hypothetical protein